MRNLPSEEQMWRATTQSDASFDGVFVLAVKTTGIFCRPVCTARMPNRENVEFFATPRDALVAGYRPCKRCRPMDHNGEAPQWVNDLLTRVEQAPQDRIRDTDLRAMEIDPARARRYFKSHYGMTFQAYHRSRRLGSALAHIRRGDDLTAVGLTHGFESNSGFREAFERLFGRTPGRSRDTDCLVVQWVDTPIGPFIAGATDEGVCLFEFADRRSLEVQITNLRKRLGCAAIPDTNSYLEQLVEEMARYFDDALTRFDVRLAMQGTEFQHVVWKRLQEIPYGQTTTYEQMARDIGRPGAQRAVGRANGFNPIAIIVPCHRVVRSDGHLGGYGGGLWRKQLLLNLENTVLQGQSEKPNCSREPYTVLEHGRAG